MHFIKESVFVSSIRAFCASFMSIIGIALALILIVFALTSTMSHGLTPEKSMVTILPDAKGNRNVLPMDTPAILCLRIHGEIGLKDLTAEHIQNILLDSREDLLANNRVKGILLHINSPGGEIVNTDDIYLSLEEYSKTYNVPVYAFVDGLCASGGMYLASAAKKIYATRSSIIGSVGCRIGPVFNFTGTMDKIGVQALTLTQGKDKDFLNPFRTWKPDEGKELSDLLTTYYEIFTDVVTKARPQITKDQLINVYGANVYPSHLAQKYGYIDYANASYADALNGLIQEAGIAADAEYQVVQLSVPHTFFSDWQNSSPLQALMNLLGFKSLSDDPHVAWQGKALYLYEPGFFGP